MEITSKPLDLLKKYDKHLFTQDIVEYNAVDIGLLETKKLILNEEIDQIVNKTLRELYKPPQRTHDTKPCKQSVNSTTLQILGTVPAPKNSLCVAQSKLNNNVKNKHQLATQSLLKKIDEIKNKHEVIINKKRLLRKYFQIWKGKLKKRKVNDDEKFKVFFDKLEKSKQIIYHTRKLNRSRCINNFNGNIKVKSVENVNENVWKHSGNRSRNKSEEELSEKNTNFGKTKRSKSVGFLNETNKEIVSNQCLENNSDEYQSLENQSGNITIKCNKHASDCNNINDINNYPNECNINPNENDESKNDVNKIKIIETEMCIKDQTQNENQKNSKPIVTASFENRYKAQQDIITKQKLKLLEQERLIEEMKHGKVCEELDFSMKESRLELEEILRKCSLKTKLKIGASNIQENANFCEDLPSIEVKINKAPKIVQKMEKRAQERAEKRELIKERKRIIDEEKKRMAEELVENKKKQDEEERKRNLAAIKERRRKELEMDKIRKENKERFLLNCQRADVFYRKVLLRRFFKGFKMIREIGEENFYKTEIFREIKLERKCFKEWRKFNEDVKEERLRKADEFYKKMLLRKCFDLFIQNRNVTKKNYQVAMDYNDFRLQRRTFQWLLNYTCKERMRRYKLQIKADRHYNYRILVTYFYQWKSLKAVLVLEKAKEEKKKKWREKVLQILPDYKPPIFDV